jgi:hypothetical protein
MWKMFSVEYKYIILMLLLSGPNDFNFYAGDHFNGDVLKQGPHNSDCIMLHQSFVGLKCDHWTAFW